MTRYCLGPTCRDLTPTRTPRARWCAVCRVAVRNQRRRREFFRYLRKPGKRAEHRARSLAWWRSVGAARRQERRAA